MHRWLLLLFAIGCTKKVETDEPVDTDADTAPTAPVVAIEPAEPLAGQQMQAVIVTPSTDVDGDEITYRYDWLVNGARSSARGDLVDGVFVLTGDKWDVKVYANDGIKDSEPGRAKATVINGPPVINAEIRPNPAYTDDLLTVIPNAYDPETDPFDLTYAWRINGVAAGDTETLDPSLFVRGDTIDVDVQSIQDGADSTMDTVTLVISNSPPKGAVAAITPENPNNDDDIVCSGSGATDIDGDEVGYSFEWRFDGAKYTGTTGTTVWPGDTIPAAIAPAAVEWECTAIPNDGVDDGKGAVATVTYGLGPYLLGTCGASGASGPTQEACDAAYDDTFVSVTVTNGVQRWVAPGPGLYRFDVYGAEGASAAGFKGGGGAWMSGVFYFDGGAELDIAVGQSGTASAGGSAGGGGGTWVMGTDAAAKIVAGGGGGARIDAEQDACGGVVEQNGSEGSGTEPTGACATKTGTPGYGGAATDSYGAGGGGYGLVGDDDGDYGFGGGGWFDALYGGATGTACADTTSADGGFGGGGSGHGCPGGGGGGGYSGGDGGWLGGGGGSFNGGIRTDGLAGANHGDGYLIIERLDG
jgi:hypothetical protein